MKIVRLVIPLIFVLLSILYVINKADVAGVTDDNILIFTTPTCPHCKVVKDYISQNNILEKLPLVVLDANKPAYSKLLSEKANICQLDPTSIGVPFYFYQNECLSGDQPIIDQLDKMLQ